MRRIIVTLMSITAILASVVAASADVIGHVIAGGQGVPDAVVRIDPASRGTTTVTAAIRRTGRRRRAGH